MTAEEYVERAYKQNVSIRQKQRRLTGLREIATSTTAFVSDMPHASGDPQRLDGVLSRIIDLEREIAQDRMLLKDMKADVAVVLARLNSPTQMQVMSKRYLEFKSWKEVAADMGKSTRWTLQQRNRALNEIVKICSIHS